MVAGCSSTVCPVSRKGSCFETPRAIQTFDLNVIRPCFSAHAGVFARFQLKKQLASKEGELDEAASTTMALDKRLAEEEEQRRNAHTSVMRLEAQVMNPLTTFIRLRCARTIYVVFDSRLACLHFSCVPTSTAGGEHFS